MTFRVVRHRSGAELLEVAGPLLTANEAENNLQLSLAARVRTPEAAAGAAAVLATVEDQGSTVGAAIRIPPRHLTLSRMPVGATTALANVLASDPSAVPGVVAVNETADAFAHAWAAATATRPVVEMDQRIYGIREVTAPTGVPGAMRVATPADEDLLIGWVVAFGADAHLPAVARDDAAGLARDRIARGALVVWTLPDGRDVSMAAVNDDSPSGSRIGMVYTPPEARRRGYASALVAALSQRELDRGRAACFLYTDLANPTSNRIYRAVGYRPVCDVRMFRFDAPQGAA